jgi:hypothetical protein
MRAASLPLGVFASLALCTGCYESHLPRGAEVDFEDPPRVPQGPMVRTPEGMRLPERPKFERPVLPPIQCTAQPAPECVSSFPRVMVVMDASSSMLAGRTEGENNWDKARFALAGNPRVQDPADERFVQPAFARELDVRGNLVTMEDVFHLGLLVFNAREVQQLVLQYTPCAADNLAWAMDPYVSCEPPGCIDPYAGEPTWTYKNSNVDRDPPFVQPTLSYMPPCNPGGMIECVGTTYNTYTAEGLLLAEANLAAYREVTGGAGLSAATRFANILITDGETSPDSEPEPVLERMLAAGVPTYVIGLAPRGPGSDIQRALVQLDHYAAVGGTQLATLVRADERDIAQAFFDAVTRVIDEIGTDPCCQPNRCSQNPEPILP